MTNPFAAAIEILSHHECRDFAEASMVRKAMNVLEAAGKVDKELSLQNLRDGFNGKGMDEYDYISIRALLSALPEVTK